MSASRGARREWGMRDSGVRDGNIEGVGEFRERKFLQDHLADR